MLKILLQIVIYSSLLFGGITGKLSGKIVDADTKEPLFGANIILDGRGLGAASDVNGNYVILNIPPGRYEVKVSCIGYNSVVYRDVQIVIDQTTILNIELKQTTIETQAVIVMAKADLVRKDMTGTISVMTRDEIEALPVANFTDLLSLQAGVIGSGDNLHIRGGRSNEVAYLVDGMYVTDPLLGGLATQLNNDAIQEMTLLSGTFNAEYGNALSGVVNVVTREGSDKYRGKVEMRTSEFGIDEFADMHQLRINGSFSGPLYGNAVKLFISGEKDYRGSYLPFGYNRDLTLFGKLTFSFLPGIKMNLSGRTSTNERQTYRHVYKYIPQRHGITNKESVQNIFSLTHTISDKMFYDVKLSYFNQGYFSGLSRDTTLYTPETDLSFIITRENGREYRDFYSNASPVSLTESRTAAADVKFDLTWQFNQMNEIRSGFLFKKYWLRLLDIYGIKRPLYLQYVDNYSTDRPYQLAGYLQDKIELPYLVINLGLRFDYMDPNVSFRTNPLDSASMIKVKPRYQFSPRVGIAHPISDRTKIHFSYGHFFQNPDYQFLFENKEYKISVREPIFGQASLDAQRTVAYEVGLTHQFTDRMAINLTAYFKDITGLIGTHYYFPYTDGRYIGYTVYVNEDYAFSKGFEINMDIRPDKYFSGGLTYTYSVSKGSASSEAEQYPGTTESTLLYYLDFDKTHVINASASFIIPESEGPTLFGNHIFGNMDFNFVFTFSSGYPYTPSGRDVGFVIKNSLRQPSNYSLDMEAGKEIEVYTGINARVFAEVLNVFDTKNIVSVYTDTGDPDYTLVGNRSKEYQRNPANYGAPRQVRIGVGFKF